MTPSFPTRRSSELVLGVSLAFGVPVVLIVGGIVWGPLMDWDLTQPQATLIAGFVAGPFLITAAYIAFQIGRAHVWTPVTNAHLVCRLLLDKKKNYTLIHTIPSIDSQHTNLQ